MKNAFIATTLVVKSSILYPSTLGVFVFLSLRVSPHLPTVSLGVPFCRQLGLSIITSDFAISSLIFPSTTSMVILVAPVYDKCLKIDSASDLLLFLRIIEIESRISFSNISIISQYNYQINITRPSTTFREPIPFTGKCFNPMRYSYRLFEFRLNLGTQQIFNVVFRVVNEFFSFPDIMSNVCIVHVEHPVFLLDMLFTLLRHSSLCTHHKPGVKVFH